MTQTLLPPAPHAVTTAVGDDGSYYATCACGWRSEPSQWEQTAQSAGRQHHVGSDLARQRRQAKMRDPLQWTIAGTILGVFLVLVAVLALGGSGSGTGSSGAPSSDACSRAYINDTGALARCYVNKGVGLSPDDAVEVERQTGRLVRP